MEALKKGDDETAYELFQQLGDYKDAASYDWQYLCSSAVYEYPEYKIWQKTAYEYDAEGRRSRYAFYATKVSAASEVTEYFYDAAGKMSSLSEDYWMYNSNGKALIEYPSTTTAEYNEHGDVLTKHILYEQELKDGTRATQRIYDYVYTYEYNDDGTMAKMQYVLTTEQLQSDGTYTLTTNEYERTYEYEYDAEGKVISSVEHNGDVDTVAEYTYDAFGNKATKTVGESTTTYEYIRKLTKVD